MKGLANLMVAGLLAVGTPAVAQSHARALQFSQGDEDLQGLPPLLRHAVEASAHLRYIGTRVVEIRRAGAQIRHVEYVTRDGDRLRVEFPANSPYAGQIIVENAFARKQYDPSKNEIHIQPPRRDETVGRLVRAAKRHRVTVEAGMKIAGLSTQQLSLQDDAGNVFQRIYIEPHSGVILKRQVYDPVGTPLGGFEFTQIDLNPKIDSSVFSLNRLGATIVRPMDDLREIASKADFPLLFLKPASGFNLMWSHMAHLGHRDALMEMYVAPGKGRVTLYELKTPVSEDALAHFAKDTLQVYAWSVNGLSLVLIGNQTKPELQDLSSAVADR
jgi:outer membrane lipoprotein-sorting protein